MMPCTIHTAKSFPTVSPALASPRLSLSILRLTKAKAYEIEGPGEGRIREGPGRPQAKKRNKEAVIDLFPL
jgi:hypothetical protein